MKPRMRRAKFRHGKTVWWLCAGDGAMGFGKSMEQAYCHWSKEHDELLKWRRAHNLVRRSDRHAV